MRMLLITITVIARKLQYFSTSKFRCDKSFEECSLRRYIRPLEGGSLLSLRVLLLTSPCL